MRASKRKPSRGRPPTVATAAGLTVKRFKISADLAENFAAKASAAGLHESEVLRHLVRCWTWEMAMLPADITTEFSRRVSQLPAKTESQILRQLVLKWLTEQTDLELKRRKKGA